MDEFGLDKDYEADFGYTAFALAARSPLSGLMHIRFGMIVAKPHPHHIDIRLDTDAALRCSVSAAPSAQNTHAKPSWNLYASERDERRNSSVPDPRACGGVASSLRSQTAS